MSEQEEMIAAAERYLSRQPVHERDNSGRQLFTRDQMLRAFCAGHVAVVENDTTPHVAPDQAAASDDGGTECPVCSVALAADDICARDIEMGICHAPCLEGSPVVDLETGDEIEGGKADTFRYGDDPLAAFLNAQPLA